MSIRGSVHRIAVALVALALLPAAATAAKTQAPRFATGGVTHILGTTAELEGTVNTENEATSYYFQYGPTLAYGQQTKPVPVPIPNPLKPVPVGQTVTGLQAGWHYRIVGEYVLPSGQTVLRPGKDKQFKGGKTAIPHIVLGKGKENRVSAVYGGTAEIPGTLTGLNNTGRSLTMQTTPFPFTSPFESLPGTVLTGHNGSFTFRLRNATANTEVRITTVAPRPLYSETIVVHVSPRITLRVRSAGHTGIFRLFGTVSPARVGAPLQIQQLLPQKPGSTREGPRPHVLASTVLKRASSKMSRFSVIVRLTGNYRYRAYVKLPKGAVESGPSGNVLIKAPKTGHPGRR